jgi:hypothetical protein
MLFRLRIIFRQYIPKKYKRFGIKMYKLFNMNDYMYNMNIYLRQGRQNEM